MKKGTMFYLVFVLYLLHAVSVADGLLLVVGLVVTDPGTEGVVLLHLPEAVVGAVVEVVLTVDLDLGHGGGL